MPTFAVTIEEMVRHTITIEADDVDTARENALKVLLNEGEAPFNSEVKEREAILCLLA